MVSNEHHKIYSQMCFYIVYLFGALNIIFFSINMVKFRVVRFRTNLRQSGPGKFLTKTQHHILLSGWNQPVATEGAQCNAYSAVFMLSAMLALGGPTRERERRGPGGRIGIWNLCADEPLSTPLVPVQLYTHLQCTIGIWILLALEDFADADAWCPKTYDVDGSMRPHSTRQPPPNGGLATPRALGSR
jgi:hypothetical protein